MIARRLTLATLAALCAVACGSIVVAAPAQAAVTHKYLSQIAEVPASSGAPLTGPLSGLNAMTVDSGQLWVAEHMEGTSSFRVDEFDASSGAFVSQLAQPGPSLNYFDNGIAVGHATGEAELYVGADAYPEGSPEGAVAVYNATGELQAVWSGADTPNKAFGCFECGGSGGVAVDNSASLGDWAAGDVYVSAPLKGVVDVFKPEAGGKEKYITQLTGPEPGVPFSGPYGVAVSGFNGDVLVEDGFAAVDVFEPTALGEYAFVRQMTGTPGGSFSRITGVAVDGNGDIYVSDEGGAVDQFSSAGVYLGHLTGTPAGAFGEIKSVAVDPIAHHVYVGVRDSGVDVFGENLVLPDVVTGTGTVEGLGVKLEGEVNPDRLPVTLCEFEYGQTSGYGQRVPCENGPGSGSSPVKVTARVSGLVSVSEYHFRLVAGNANGQNEGSDATFISPPGPPTIESESATGVTAESASLQAQIDPEGAETTYHFDYGTSGAYGQSTPESVSIGAGAGGLPVNVHLQGLQPGTTYHYRVVATNTLGSVPGADHVFTTQGSSTEVTLPDNRQWELVSPPNKQGTQIYPPGFVGGNHIQAAQGGGAITYGASAPLVANPAGNRALELAQGFSTRHAPGSWETTDITTPHNEELGNIITVKTDEYEFFSSDLSLGLVEPPGHTPLPPLPPGSEKTVYVRNDASGEYQALVTSANVPPGTEFGGDGEKQAAFTFISATPDLSHVVLRSKVALTSTPVGEGGLYEWSGGQLQLASVLSDGKPAGGSFSLGYRGIIARHAISNDGSRILWGETFGNESLFMRDMVRGETVKLGEGLQFATASTDASRVFFSTGEEGGNLGVFEVTSGKGEPLAGSTTMLTESGEVEGVIGASEDGSSVYFVDTGVLGDGAARGAESGGANLYAERYDAAAKAWAPPTFIAVLAGQDYFTWGGGERRLDRMTSRVSPDGRYLAFMSERSLTGYDNRDASSGMPDEEVFLYDASTGRLACASCDPTGARPAGMSTGEGGVGPLIDYNRPAWEGRWLAANVPTWNQEGTYAEEPPPNYQPRYLSNEGRLFFNSADALVPADVNGTADVYEYEPAGVGGCQPPGYGQSASVVFVEKAGGCVGLVSAGTSSEESVFMDASETGGDVFFITLSHLSPRDYDTNFDMYDAHECAPSSPCAPPAALTPPPCATGDACKPGPTPQPTLFGEPSSETFTGAGNLIAPSPVVVRSRPKAKPAKCKKGFTKKHGGCVKRRAKKAIRSARGRK